ncbi:MAG: ABC transporter permease [Gammaproteobacteria bacterium]|nr:ABC transporter permease [Gammaproteobacteria bacterium]
MELLQYTLRKLIAGIPLIFGVTFISFLLMVYFGPDKTYELLGKNPTEQQIAEIRTELGYDQPFVTRYFNYVTELATLDFGRSESSGEQVNDLLARTIPVSLALVTPGFIFGNLFGVLLALLAASRRGSWLDKTIMGFSAVGMSISFLIAIIAFQLLLSSNYGLGWFPVRGWNIHNPLDYVRYVTVPTLATVFVALGYNTRFYRAVIVEELTRDHIRTAKAFGIPKRKILAVHVLKNCMIPIITRIVFSIPLIVISGSLLLETYFGIPGVGKVAFDAITTGDQPVLKAVVGWTAVLFVFAQLLTDILYRAADPRVSLN